MKFVLVVVATVMLVSGGCARLGQQNEQAETSLESYLEYCHELAVGNGPIVGAKWEGEATYGVVYADERYLSFRAEESSYCGGAHGSRQVTVGTFDRATGRRLTARDLVPAERRDEVLRSLRQKVVSRLGGEDKLLDEVTLTDNCCLGADGLHFVYNEYEVACYAEGMIEVVIPR